MTTLAEKLLEEGIRPLHYRDGDQKLLCPTCSHHRKKKSDPCLSLTIDGDSARWLCHNSGCGFSGAVGERRDGRREWSRRERRPPTKPTRQPAPLTPAAVSWFADRGISEAAVRRLGIGVARQWIPAARAEVDCIAFVYRRGGEDINIKFRALASKAFAQVKGAEKILYGLDDIADSTVAIVVEGECDKLAFEEAGIRHVISVPDGAPPKVKEGEPEVDDPKFDFLANCDAELDRIERFILAVDDDAPGRALEEELARRLGRERCWRVRWPTSNDAPCKDANDVLRVHGPAILRELVEQAQPFPIAGLHGIGEFADETLALYRDGRKRGHSTGWPSLDELMTIRAGELSIITGVPNSGKSEFVDALTLNLARQYGWQFALCSFENPPAEHISKLAEKYLGLPFWDGPSTRMGEAELSRAIDWVADHFHLIRADENAPTIDWILGAARGAVLRHGIRGLVIDPYNEIEHHRPSNQTETEYVSQLLGKVKRFAQGHGVHVWFVAHPAKMLRDRDGNRPVPTLYDISGSANWANKADLGVVVDRDPMKDPTRTNVYVRKVRFKSVGKIGVASFRYEASTGRYFEMPANAVAARRYHDD